MNFKNIPVDIKSKSIKEAKEEVSEILNILEKEDDLNNLTEKYQRLITLDNYIVKKFKDKSKTISKKTVEDIKHSLSKK